MRAIETFHYTFSEAGTHTFDLGKKPYAVFVKNMTSGEIKFSFGEQIDTTNDSYVQMKKDTGETVYYQAWDDKATVSATIQAAASGDVEIRILAY